MLIEILQRTPPWVFVLFIVLVGYGLLQTRTRHITLARVATLPAVLIGLSATSVWATFAGMASALAGWAAGIGAALLLNRAVRWPRRVGYAPETGRFLVEGSWLPLAAMMAIFFTRYATNVALAIKPGLAGDPAVGIPVGFAYGLLSGAFLARSLRIFSARRGAEVAPA